ncbi:MAG: alpha amylase C-terminal domain-containing protein [Muricomes sp.]
MLHWEQNILSYGRFKDDEQIIVVLNNSKDLKEVTVPVWLAEVPRAGRMERLLYSYEEGYTTERDEYIVVNGEVVLNMGRHSVVIMRPKKES